MGESAAASARTETASELPFENPQTAREKAAAIERSKRDAEMAELRRLRAENTSGEGSGVGGVGVKFGQQISQTTSSDAARRKREEEMEEIRRLKAGENQENRKRLSQLGGPLTTDMDAWRKNQWGAQAADRKNKLEAQSNLKSHSGYYETKTEAALDKAAYTQAQKERMAGMKELSLDDQEEPYAHPEGGVMEGGKWLEEDSCVKGNVMFKDGADEQIPIPKVNRRLRVSFSSKDVAQILPQEEEGEEGDKQDANERSIMFKDVDEQIPIQKEERKTRVSFSNKAAHLISPEVAPPKEEDAQPKVQFAALPAAAEPEPERKMPPGNIPETVPAEEANIVPVQESIPADGPNEPAPTPPPTYSRVDIKFSFGLIVRSSVVDGFETENLRDNETLRKCMEGTSKILHVQLPSPPDVSVETDFSNFPEAYYDPTLEPNIISIEEDQRKVSSDGKKTTTTAKGNKRTLVKASFPVFLREEKKNEEGKKRSARMLKETKTTVFKALRAAVSGGSFLR